VRKSFGSFFKKNLAALREKDPYAAKLVSARKHRAAEVRVETFRARSGDPTMKAASSAVKGEILLHSAYDPRAEAVQWAEQFDFSRDHIVVALGFGMGYYADEILDRINDDSFVLLVERNPAVLREAMKSRDLTHVFRSPRVFFAVGDDELAALMKFRALCDPRKALEPLIVEHIPSTVLHPGFYGNLPGKMRDDFIWIVKNFGTVACLSPMWHNNSLLNLPTAAASPGVVPLRGLFEGKPAIVVAAGPSLDKNIRLIKKAAGKALIISVGTALKPLQNHGIRPHFAVVVDGHHMTYSQFEGVDLDGIYLVSSLAAYPRVLDLFKDRAFVWDCANPVMDWVGGITGERGTLQAGGTVSVTAMDLAVACGCDPVITVGLDLCFAEDGITHASGTIHDGTRFDLEGMRRVPGTHRETVPTSNIFYSFLRNVERHVRGHPDTKFINATADGAFIEGTEVMDLDRAIRTYCTVPFEARDAIAEAWRRNLPENVDRLLDAISEVLAEFRKVEGLARTAATLCNRLIFHTKVVYDDSEKTASAILRRLKRIDASILRRKTQDELMSMMMKPILYSMEAKAADHEKNYTEAVRTYMRSRKLYEGIVSASFWTRKMLKEARRIIKKNYRKEIGRNRSPHAVLTAAG